MQFLVESILVTVIGGTVGLALGVVFAQIISSLVGQYVYLVDVKSDNDRLVYENARLRSSQRELADALAENRRLRRLLGLRDTVQRETVSALVVAKDTTEYFRVWHLTIDTPNAAVRPDMPVISLDGAVGTVLRDWRAASAVCFASALSFSACCSAAARPAAFFARIS
jgi:cell shape-determining protein MreC